jgi:hypothetical protein
MGKDESSSVSKAMPSGERRYLSLSGVDKAWIADKSISLPPCMLDNNLWQIVDEYAECKA